VAVVVRNRFSRDTGVVLAQKTYISTTLGQLGMEHTHSVSTSMHPNVTLDMAENWAEKEWNDITDYPPVVESLIYAAHPPWANDS